jgi:hypothetical protein
MLFSLPIVNVAMFFSLRCRGRDDLSLRFGGTGELIWRAIMPGQAGTGGCHRTFSRNRGGIGLLLLRLGAGVPLERAVILSDGDILFAEETRCGRNQSVESAYDRRWKIRNENLIEGALMNSRGRVSGPQGTARLLRIARTTLESKIKSLRIDKNRYRVEAREFAADRALRKARRKRIRMPGRNRRVNERKCRDLRPTKALGRLLAICS